MADLVNLRTERKRVKRRQQDKAAAANRLAHGVPTDMRKAERARRDKAIRDLERHRLENGNGDGQ